MRSNTYLFVMNFFSWGIDAGGVGGDCCSSFIVSNVTSLMISNNLFSCGGLHKELVWRFSMKIY